MGAVFLVVLSILLSKRRIVCYVIVLATICVAACLAVWCAVVSPPNAQMAQSNSVLLLTNWTASRKKVVPAESRRYDAA